MRQVFDDYRSLQGKGRIRNLLRVCHRRVHGESCSCPSNPSSIDLVYWAAAVRPVTKGIKKPNHLSEKDHVLLETTLDFDFTTMRPGAKQTPQEPLASEEIEMDTSADTLDSAVCVNVKVHGYATVSRRESSYIEHRVAPVTKSKAVYNDTYVTGAAFDAVVDGEERAERARLKVKTKIGA